MKLADASQHSSHQGERPAKVCVVSERVRLLFFLARAHGPGGVVGLQYCEPGGANTKILVVAP